MGDIFFKRIFLRNLLDRQERVCYDKVTFMW